MARFEERLVDPARSWKIAKSDYTERNYWDDDVSAFEDAMTAPSAKNSPCFVIPANHNWFHNLAMFQIIAETMEGLDRNRLSISPKSSENTMRCSVRRRRAASGRTPASRNSGERQS
ncbi:hypothetical protein QM467_05595 [Rhodoblastus sp. 17X3]|uniref:hypothetical protein n=1 Tax=Rhodoblastus sp. 17X3 TaxID=3047026 RepID=UPI0024B75084|nr:hypothetical protein [Rhodoblastus sp. 17X3]MDI9847533.1 hypothetical protein [Rhodoblastus sp. 17X3]